LIEFSHNGAVLKNKSLDEKLLELLKRDNKRTEDGLAEVKGVSPRTIQRALKRLMESGRIEHTGSNHGGHYIVKKSK